MDHQAECCAGQGLNMALEDGAVLAGHVQEKGLSPATLRAFEKERVSRVAAIVRQEEACPACNVAAEV